MKGPERLPRPRGLFGVFHRDERGTALVEFALVALPLFLILFGIIDFARALNYYNDLTQIAGQGARAAAVDCNPDNTCGSTYVTASSIQTQLLGDLDSPEMKQVQSPARTKICIQNVPNGNGAPVTVKASYEFHFIPLVHPIALTLSASQTERFEGLTAHYQTGCVSP